MLSSMARRDLRRVVLDVWEGIVYMGEGKKREESCETMNYWREENGKFESIEDIMKIDGIKEKMFDKIKDSITVS